MGKSDQIVGVISDTHGLLRPEAIDRLQGCDLIIHAGDIDSATVLEDLRRIAPVVAVKGNVDRGKWTRELKEIERVECLGHKIIVIHNIRELGIPIDKSTADIIIYGHSHRPRIEYRQDVLVFNPGSAGPRRFELPITVGRIILGSQMIRPELINLE